MVFGITDVQVFPSVDEWIFSPAYIINVPSTLAIEAEAMPTVGGVVHSVHSLPSVERSSETLFAMSVPIRYTTAFACTAFIFVNVAILALYGIRFQENESAYSLWHLISTV